MSQVEIFVLLQVLDFLTTLIGLRLGGSELSPFVRWLMQFGQVTALIQVKLLGFALGAFCVWTHRTRVIVWVNYFFAGLVIWNLCNILRASSP